MTPATKTIQIPGFEPVASASWVAHYIADLNDRDDPFDGEVPDHVMRFDHFRLETIELSSTDMLDHQYDPGLAAEYAAMSADTAPPVVFDPVAGCLIDGFHRTRAAWLRGESTVVGYVGYCD